MMPLHDPSSDKTLPPEAFKAGMRKLAAAVTLVTVRGEQGRNGLTATAVCSVSAEPPQLLCCINRNASAYPALCASGFFAVNILKPEHRRLAEHFVRQPPGESRFTTGDWQESPAGLPVLADALAWFECRLINVIEAGSHGISLGLVTACRHDSGSHLLYAEGSYQTLVRDGH